MSKTSWILGILSVVMIVVVANYIRLVYVMSNNRQVYDALPESSTVIFEFNNIGKTLDKLSKTSFEKDIFEASFLKKFKNQINYIDSLVGFITTDTLVTSDDQAKVLASLNLTKKSNIDYLYLIDDNKIKKEEFEQLLSAKTREGFKITKRTFRSEDILEIYLQGSGEKLTCAYLKGILIASFTPFLVEESIVQLKDKPSILKDPGFNEIRDLGVENADALVYLNFANLDLLQPLLFNSGSAKYMKLLTAFGEWMELDLKIRENSIIANGYAIPGSRKNALSKFSKEPSSEIDVTRILPFNTSLFFYYSVNDFENYLGNYIANISVENLNYFKNWIGNEWCFGILEPFDENFEEEGFLVIKANDQELATESLMELSRLEDEDAEEVAYKDFKIGRLPIGEELNNILDHDFVRINHPYYTIIDQYVVLASKLSVLKTIISQYIEDRSIAHDPDYLAFKENLTNSSNYYVYINTSRMGEILNGMLSDVLATTMNQGDKNFMKFSPVGFQFSYYEGIFFTNGYVQYQSHIEESTNRIWQTKLEANPAIPPTLVINHYTNDKEIFIQDSLKNIYLITKAGKILWKKQIDNIIMSDVYQIDFYENTKLQYLFNTKNQIYLVDRTGKSVAGYPIKLPAEASNGLLLVDYGNKKEYRIFIACKNNNIYGYYRSGKPLPGWSPQSNVGLVAYPIKHILVDGKDYLIAANNGGKVFYFNRRGEKRVPPIDLKKSFSTDFQLVKFNNTFQLYNADKQGNLYKVYRNGTFSAQNQGITTHFFDIQTADLKNDGKPEFLFVDSSIVKVYDIKFKEIFTSAFPNQLDQPGFVVNDSNGKVGFGLLSKSKRNIYLLDEDLNFHSAFPLYGCTEFREKDLYDTGRKVIVVGGCDASLIAYQIR